MLGLYESKCKPLLSDKTLYCTFIKYFGSFILYRVIFLQSSFKEAQVYSFKYRHLQNRAISLIQNYVNNVLNHATEQILTPDETNDSENVDTAYAVYFGKFLAIAPKLKMVISEVEKRAEHSEEYVRLC